MPRTGHRGRGGRRAGRTSGAGGRRSGARRRRRADGEQHPEQALTGRPDSYVPARTVEGVFGWPGAQDDAESWRRNHLWHWGHGAVVGSLRGVMAAAGLNGPWASAMFGVVRQTSDQTFENATGAGASPWTWPRDELAVDLLHKSVCALVNGAVADRLLAGR